MKTHKRLKMNVKINKNGLDKTMTEFSAYVAFDKATNGQTDVKHEMEKTLS